MGRSNLTFFIIAGILLIVTGQFASSPLAATVAVLVNVMFFEFLRQHYIINRAPQDGALVALSVLDGWFILMLLLSLLATTLHTPSRGFLCCSAWRRFSIISRILWRRSDFQNELAPACAGLQF